VVSDWTSKVMVRVRVAGDTTVGWEEAIPKRMTTYWHGNSYDLTHSTRGVSIQNFQLEK
jgi:hypothetical protein